MNIILMKIILLILIILITFFLIINTIKYNNKLEFKLLDAKVLMYHRFDDARYPSTNISLKDFKKQIDVIVKNKYKVITCSQYLKLCHKKNKDNHKYIIITIDDGFKSIKNVLPIFDEYNFKFTLFLNMKEILSNSPDYFSIDDIKKLIDSGHDIQNHTFSHKVLPSLNETEMKNEIMKNHDLLLKLFNVNSNIFSLPYGNTNYKIINFLKEKGYELCFGQHTGTINEYSDKYYLPRFSCTGTNYSKSKERIIEHNKNFKVIDIYPKYVFNKSPYIISIYINKLFIKSLKNNYIFLYVNNKKFDNFKIFNDRIIIFFDNPVQKKNIRMNLVYQPKDIDKSKWLWYSHILTYSDDYNLNWYNKKEVVNFIKANDVYKVKNVYRLPLGFRTNNWGCIQDNNIKWNGRLYKENDSLLDVNFLNENKNNRSNNKILVVFKNPLYGLRSLFILLMNKAMKVNKSSFLSIQNLIDTNYMEDSSNYIKNYKNKINKKFDLFVYEEAKSFVIMMFTTELGNFNNLSFYSFIPKKFSDNLIKIAYHISYNYIINGKLYETNFKKKI